MMTTKARVLLFAPADTTGQTDRMLQERGCEIATGNASWHTPQGNNEAEMVALARDCDALAGTSIKSTPITRPVMEASDKLRIVAKYTIGCDDVDVKAATEMGILVTHSPTESNWGGVAEGTMANILCMLKKLRERDQHMKSGGEWRDPALTGVYLGSRDSDGWPGITIGIVGLGRVGTRLADLLKPWKLRILACDPYIPESHFAEHGAERVDLPTLMAQADVVTLHVYLNEETRHLIGKAELALMKPTAILNNASRGPVVDEPELVAALQGDRIAGAALDVFENEPLALDSPLRTLGNKVLLSPHMISSNAGSGLKPGIIWATESVIHALKGEVPDNVFNKEVIPAWMERFGGRSVIG